MTEEERAIVLEETRLSLGMLPIEIVRQMKADDKKSAERDKQRANTKGSAASKPLEIDNDDDENENYSNNDKREYNLFSDDSNANPDKGGYRDPDDNDPGDDSDPEKDYSQSTDDEQTKKKKSSRRKTPTSAIRIPRNAHWACLKTPKEGEAADVMVAISAEPTISKFMAEDGLDCIDEIQELTENTIALYAKNIKRHLPHSNFIITRFVLDLKRAAFKMTHIKNRVSIPTFVRVVVSKPLEINDDTDENDNDSDNENQEDDLFSNDRNNDPYKGGYRDPHHHQL